jgi:sulfur carrier protein
MEITINQTVTEIPDRSSVQDFLTLLFPDSSKGIAIAINKAVVPKSKWPVHIILPEDKITLIKATQGG